MLKGFLPWFARPAPSPPPPLPPQPLELIVLIVLTAIAGAAVLAFILRKSCASWDSSFPQATRKEALQVKEMARTAKLDRLRATLVPGTYAIEDATRAVDKIVGEDATRAVDKTVRKAVGRLKKSLTQTILDARLRFLPFESFVRAGRIPRFGSNADFVHPEADAPNENLCRPLASFDMQNTVFIFVSHRWLQPRPGGASHPDDRDGSKHKLIVNAVERMRGSRAPIPTDMEIALWIECVLLGSEDAAAGGGACCAFTA